MISNKKRKHLFKLLKRKTKRFIRKQKKVLLILPIVFYAIYTAFIQTEQYEGYVSVGIENQKQELQLTAFNLTGQSNNVKNLLMIAQYVKSHDVALYLNKQLNIKEHYQKAYRFDPIFGFKSDKLEDLLKFYKKKIKIAVNNDAEILILKYRDPDKDIALKVIKEVIKKSEVFLNKLTKRALEQEVLFYKNELEEILKEIKQSQSSIINRQIKDKEFNAASRAENTVKSVAAIEAELLQRKAKLAELQTYLQSNSLQIQIEKQKIKNLERNLQDMQIGFLSQDGASSKIVSSNTDQIELELLLQKYQLTLQSLESKKFDLLHSSKYLVTVEEAYVPDSIQYPKALLNIILFIVAYFMVFFIIKIIIEVIYEQKFN